MELRKGEVDGQRVLEGGGGGGEGEGRLSRMLHKGGFAEAAGKMDVFRISNGRIFASEHPPFYFCVFYMR